MRLGKTPKKTDLRTIQLKDYLTAVTVPKAPSKLDEFKTITQWPMFKNDQWGDCVEAGAAHITEFVTKLGENKEAAITDHDVQKMYSDITGFNPANPNSDQGTNMLDALNYWRKTGIAGNKIEGFAEFDPKDHTQWKLACYLFGNAYVGLALPETAQKQSSATSEWKVTSHTGQGAAGSWGGHCVAANDYDADTVKVITWGYVQKATWGFISTYCDEAYVVFSDGWINNVTKKSPQGFDLAALQHDLSQFHK